MAFPLKSRRSRVVAVTVGITMLVVWWASAYPRGVLMAHLDHARGHYQVLSFGLCSQPWDDECTDLLWERYGVERNWVDGPWWLPWRWSYFSGYGSTSERLLEEKFGKDIFRECAAEARQQYQAEHPEQ
jgi:hypothetical protein